jgi:DNA invertase Pin-like site-specific DNA recombinase
LKVGYARVSANEQNLSNQISLLKENGCEDITVIMDDYSRAIAGYYISFDALSALQT